MPIYEYECPSCGHRMEAIQQLGAPALTDCPACAKTDLRRLVSAAGFRLKGSGWYATDFKDKGKTKPKSAESDGETQPKTPESDGGTKKPTDGGTPPAAKTKKPEQPSTASE
ncbi:MAG: zinc ribbon domain-containing protein [Pseudomonadota bacterium]|nr:zinc ribbon domain-containing protein [Pseudomonadota bacterium]